MKRENKKLTKYIKKKKLGRKERIPSKKKQNLSNNEPTDSEVGDKVQFF